MIVPYLNHDIVVDNSERCAAHVVTDGVRHCFLGGLKEAKRFLRERQWGSYYGPRRAIYNVMEADGLRVRELSSTASRAVADSDLTYFRANGRGVFVRRTEFCFVPGCDGYGEIKERAGRSWVTRPCPCHVESAVCDDRAAELIINEDRDLNL